MDKNVELAVKAECLLGEGPVWDGFRHVLYWTDLERGEVYSFYEATGLINRDKLGGKVTSIALCTSGKLLLTKENSIVLYNPVSKQEKTIVRHDHQKSIRFNDGKCDSSGRFYTNSMDMTEKEELGALFILEADGSFRKAASGFVIGNGMAWNDTATVMYLVDSPKKVVYQFDYCAVTGTVRNRKIAIQIPNHVGVPDGMCIDSEGMLWIAHYYGARITRWNPVTGKLLETIPVPACNVTSCCFGGGDKKTLYITTANMNLAEVPAVNRLDGSVFKLHTDVRGCETALFNDGNFPSF